MDLNSKETFYFANFFLNDTPLWYNLNPKVNAPVEWIHELIYKMTVTNDLDNKVFECIDPWDET